MRTLSKKINFSMRLKNENNQLRTALAKAQQRSLRAEANLRGESLVDALVRLHTEHACGGTEPRTPKCSRSSTHSAQTRRPSVHNTSVQGSAVDVERRCQEQESILERISIDFQHFTSLIDWAVCASDQGSSSGCSSSHVSSDSNPDVVSLLQKLRHAVFKCSDAAAAAQSQQPSEQLAAVSDVADLQENHLLTQE